MKLAIVSTHPIQYFSPWFRFLAEGQMAGSGGEKGDRRWEIGDRGVAGNGARVAGRSPSTISDLPSANLPEGFEFEVFYAHQQTAKGQAEAGFGVEFEWDVPLLEGYPHRFLKNVSKRPGLDWFGGCDCPVISGILVKEGFTHVLLIGWHKKVFWQAFRAAKKAGIKVLSRGDSQMGMTSSPLKRAAKYMLYRFLLPKFDAHLYVGRRNREYLLHYGVSDARLFFSPHFVDNQWWSMNAERSGKMGDGRWKMGSSQPPISHLPDPISEKRETVFLFAGKFIPKKRVMDLLEAAAGVPEARVVLVGDGPLREQLKVRAEKPDLKSRVEFVGFKNQKEMPAHLAAADCLVLPSDGTETWGLIVNEAMACGKPAIVSEVCGCAPDLIEEGETGYSFPLGDTCALAERLRRFCKNRNQQWEKKVSGKITQYSVKEATGGLMQAIGSVAGE